MRAAICLPLLLLATPVMANDWRMDPAASRIAFSYTQSGSRNEGVFSTFSAEIRFDPDKPGEASVRTVIDTASADTGESLRDTTLAGSDWFDVANHPEAIFESRLFNDEGDGRYTVTGDLFIAGVTREVSFPMTIEISGNEARAMGHIDIDRREFELGRGDWASDALVGYEVGIELEIEASHP